MIKIDVFRKLVLSFPETTENAHFEKISFRVKKKIFATYDDLNKRACIKLSEVHQNVFYQLINQLFILLTINGENKVGQILN